jgi:hypothetical protein
MARPSAIRTYLPALLLVGCGGGGSSGGGASTVAGVSSALPTPITSGVAAASSASAGATTSAAPAGPAPIDFVALEAAYEARRRDYLRVCVQGLGTQGENDWVQLARLELGAGPLLRAPIEGSLDFTDARHDTADFRATTLVRFLHLHGTNPLLPVDLQQRLETTLTRFRWWIDQPGQDEMVFWSENHQVMFAAGEYLTGQRFPATRFGDGRTGDEHRRAALVRLRRWLDERLRWGLSEWCSPVYYPHDVAPLLNLVDFASEPEVATRAAMVLDLLLYDLARRTHRGSFGVTAGRAYEEHKWSGRDQSVADLIELCWGTRGGWRSRGSTAATALATSRRYRPGHLLLGLGLERPDRSIDRARSGLSFAEGPAAGRGFSTVEDGMFWWGYGAYVAPETIRQSRRMIDAWGLWAAPSFGPIAPLRHVPEALLPALASTLSPLSEGSVLSPANTYVFRTPDVMLSSVQSYRPGQTGFQQHAWQATLSIDACVWTTAPGNRGHDGPTEWTGSSSLPRVVQVEDVAVVLYDPGVAIKALFAEMTHAWFPRAAFDEVVERAGWTCGRKDDGYVALWSARPTAWAQLGRFAGKELFAQGARNGWVCVVGRKAEDGSFADFVDAVTRPGFVTHTGGTSASGPFEVQVDAPGGRLVVPFRGPATLGGAPVQDRDFPRYDDPWARQAWGDPRFEARLQGAKLEHDHHRGTRAGDGL